MSTILQKIKSVKLCLMAHPDNEEHSEFADRISDLEEIEQELSKDNWIKIENKRDLPKEKCDCWFIDKELGVVSGIFHNVGKEESNFLLANTTHYQIIDKPKPPTN